MKRLPTIIILIMVTTALLTAVAWKDNGASSSTPAVTQETGTEQGEDYGTELWVDTVMYAAGHLFGYAGDVSEWGGWYFDTAPVGDDIMLRYDSVAPSKLKLSLVTKEITVDLGDKETPGKIRDFLSAPNGFSRFQEKYEEVLDSIVMPDYSYTCTGRYSFSADFADSGTPNAALINKFVCGLTDISNNDAAQVPGLSAFYAGFKKGENSRPAYTGDTGDIKGLSDFLAARAFENWKQSGDTDESSNEEKLDIRLRVYSPKLVTYSIYEYDRIGIGHGMYTETFCTLDLSSGRTVSNSDLFKAGTADGVKKLLFETMFNDKNYREWNKHINSPEEIEARIEGWQSPNELLEGTEWAEPERDTKFKLPEGALTESGVVFSFQPYEIECWAAGAFHFIVPYSKLTPYLTPYAKHLIEGVEASAAAEKP